MKKSHATAFIIVAALLGFVLGRLDLFNFDDSFGLK